VPASIRMACSSVEGASTLSEAPVVGLYQYISVPSFPQRTIQLMFPMLRTLKRLPRGSEVLLILRLTVSRTANGGAAVQRPRRHLAFSPGP
jgi:hypothetical protein